MNIKYDDAEIIQLEHRLDVDVYEPSARIEVGTATIRIRCHEAKWKRIKSKFVMYMKSCIEDQYPDVNWRLTKELYNVKNKQYGDYMIITLPFVIGEEI
jgi:hypothetical protein